MEKDKYINEFKQDNGKYEKDFSEDSLWKKLGKFAKLAGLNTSYYILFLLNVFKSNATSATDKIIIGSALGYFISPFDVIPDFLIGTGFIDDVAALALALSMLAGSITKPIKDAAKSKLREYFDFKDEELNSSYR